MRLLSQINIYCAISDRQGQRSGSAEQPTSLGSSQNQFGITSIALICGFSTWGVNVMLIWSAVTWMGTVSIYALYCAPEAFHGLKSFTSLTILPAVGEPSFTA